MGRNTLVDIYHQPGVFLENILTVLSTFPKESRNKQIPHLKALVESGKKLDMAPP